MSADGLLTVMLYLAALVAGIGIAAIVRYERRRPF